MCMYVSVSVCIYVCVCIIDTHDWMSVLIHTFVNFLQRRTKHNQRAFLFRSRKGTNSCGTSREL